MKHYDGPAFYRIHQAKKSQQITRKKINKNKNTSVHKPKKLPKRPVAKPASLNQPVLNGNSRPFQLSHVPPSIWNFTAPQRLPQRKISYAKLYAELRKEPASYYFLDEDRSTQGYEEFDLTLPEDLAEQAVRHHTAARKDLEPGTVSVEAVQADVEDGDVDRVDQVDELPVRQTETFWPPVKTVPSVDLNEKKVSAKSSEEQSSKTVAEVNSVQEQGVHLFNETQKNEQKLNDRPTEVFLPIKEQKEETAVIGRQSAELVDQSPRKLVDVTERKQQDQSEHVELADLEESPAATIEVSTTKRESENHSENKDRALNRSLADILDYEQNDQRELALFKEQDGQKHGSLEDEVTKQEENYCFPDITLLPAPVVVDDPQMDEWVLQEADVLNETLQAFHVDGTVKDWTIGPTVTQFEITLGRGVKVNKVTNLTDDLKLALAAKDIRIEAPIPGKSSIGIEIPNQKSRPVMLREVLQSNAFQSARSPLTVALGVDLFGKPQVTNLKKMPHGLIAGATGSGKSVFINSLLVSLLYKAKPSEVKLLLIDPKAVEMAPYQNIPHLLAPVVSDPKSAAEALKWVVKEMDERYERLAASGARNIDSFNEKVAAAGEYGLKMPYIVIVIDELADLMMVAASEVQDYIARITAKARAAGIHLLIATQRPSVDVVTGTIKNNIPTRVAFMVASQVDSRTILDTSGAERLLGRGDMLYLGNGAGQPIRLQGTFIDEEVDRITDFVRNQGKPQFAFDPDGLKEEALQSENEDELMPEVLEYIVNEKAVSTSKLQRVFSVGYNRAASIIEELENKRYISGAKGSKPRDVFLTAEGLAKIREN